MVMLPATLWFATHEYVFYLFFPSDLSMIQNGMAQLYGKPCPLLSKPLVELIQNPLILFFSWKGAWQRWWLPIFLYVIVVSYYVLSSPSSRKPQTIRASVARGSFGRYSFFRITIGRTDMDHWLKGISPFLLLNCSFCGHLHSQVEAPLSVCLFGGPRRSFQIGVRYAPAPFHLKHGASQLFSIIRICCRSPR